MMQNHALLTKANVQKNDLIEKNKKLSGQKRNLDALLQSKQAKIDELSACIAQNNKRQKVDQSV